MTHLATSEVEMTVTFVSETKHYAFAARTDTGASCYIAPMLAERAGLTRSSAGRLLRGVVAPNTDDHGGVASSSTPWRVMSWSVPAVSNLPGADTARRDLEDALLRIDQLRENIEHALARLA